MTRIIFLDLDDTLFHSHRKCDGGEVVAWASDGSPASFMSPRQRAFFDWIAAGAEVVPTTGRNAAAYRRVGLGFSGWAICSFGGLILRPDGSPEPSWRARIEPAVGDAAATLASLVEVAVAPGVRARVIEDDGLPLYLSAKCAPEDEALLGEVAARVRDAAPGWTLHQNGWNLACFPPFLGKEHAVRWFRANVAGPDALAIGVGDSASDAPFLAACDFAVAPARSQIVERLLGA